MSCVQCPTHPHVLFRLLSSTSSGHSDILKNSLSEFKKINLLEDNPVQRENKRNECWVLWVSFGCVVLFCFTIHIIFYVQSLLSKGQKRGFKKILKAYHLTAKNATLLLSRITLALNTKRWKQHKYHPEKRRTDSQTSLAPAKHAKHTDTQLIARANPTWRGSGNAVAIHKPIRTSPANMLPPPPPQAHTAATAPPTPPGRRSGHDLGPASGLPKPHVRSLPHSTTRSGRPAPAALSTRAAAQHSPVKSPEPRSPVPGNGHETARRKQAAGQAPHVLPMPQQGAAKPVRATVTRHGWRQPTRSDTATTPTDGKRRAPRRKKYQQASHRRGRRLHVPAGSAPQRRAQHCTFFTGHSGSCSSSSGKLSAVAVSSLNLAIAVARRCLVVELLRYQRCGVWRVHGGRGLR